MITNLGLKYSHLPTLVRGKVNRTVITKNHLLQPRVRFPQTSWETQQSSWNFRTVEDGAIYSSTLRDGNKMLISLTSPRTVTVTEKKKTADHNDSRTPGT